MILNSRIRAAHGKRRASVLQTPRFDRDRAASARQTPYNFGGGR
jgi:hypothetical protein